VSDRETGPGTAPEYVLDGLRHAILVGRLRPGDRVAQDEFAQAMGTSIAPVREALRVLEQEGQVTYLRRRGYFVTELAIADLEEIYALRRILEERAARHALAVLDDDALQRITQAAADCVRADRAGDIAAELEANKRFHFAVLDSGDQSQTMRMIRLLWASTEAYRAIYYDDADERRAAHSAHERIVEAIRQHDVDRLLRELDAHRQRALAALTIALDGR
jgi:DNA-binding GntR family transcriptional regulator